VPAPPTHRPPAAALAAFGVAGQPLTLLPGGQGTSWRAGDLVLKRAEQIPGELQWLAGVYSRVDQDRFRIARQQVATGGRVAVAGWAATRWLPGQHAQRRWADIIGVSERYHAALRELPRPDFLDGRDNPWSTGDKVAWADLPADEFADVPHLQRLLAARRAVDAPSQVIHGDLGGNVLFHETLPPAVIDCSPYWRPAEFATAIVVGDALVWEGADEEILAAVRPDGDFGQYLIRALIYRIVTERILVKGYPGAAPDTADPWAPAVEIACRLAG
jgi:uncharacterized protein (TIGR02569 family)